MNKSTMGLLVGLVVLLVLFGCTGTPTSPDLTDQNNSNDQNTGDDSSNDNSNDDNGNETVDFSKLFDLRTSLNHKIEYRFSGSFGGSAEQQVTVDKFVYYFKQNKVRTDIVAQTEQGAVESRMFFTAGDKSNVTSCSMLQGQDWTCFSMSFDAIQSQSGTNPDPLDIQEADYTITADGTKTVAAGVTGNCFKVVSKEASQSQYSSRFCMSSEGVPIYMSGTTEAGSMEMEATNISNNVTDADFTPPAQAQAMPGLGGSGSGADASICNQMPEGPQRDACLQALGGA